MRTAPACAVIIGLAIPVSRTWAQVATGGIQGQLLDRVSRMPVAGAEVFVLGQGPSHTSDANGRFRHVGLRSGYYVVEIRRIGYAQGTWEVRVDEGELSSHEFELEPVPATLAPVTVEGERKTWFKEFEERRASRRGQYITFEDIEHRKVSTLADLLRPLNGVRISCDRYGNCGILMTRWVSCRPQYYEDGHPVTAIAAERLPVLDIYGVEVYNVSEVPMEFQRTDVKCGVIAIWTRRGPPPR